MILFEMIGRRCPMERSSHKVRYATLFDVDSVKYLLDANRDIFGFLPRPVVESAVEKREVIVVEVKELLPINFAGFCRFHKRRDGQTTIYEIFVRREYRRMGIGLALIKFLDPPLLAKCPLDLASNRFYEAVGFRVSRVDRGKARELNVWRLEGA